MLYLIYSLFVTVKKLKIEKNISQSASQFESVTEKGEVNTRIPIVIIVIFAFSFKSW